MGNQQSDILEVSTSDYETTAAQGSNAGADLSENQLRPRLARLTSIKGVIGGLVLDKSGVIAEVLPDRFNSNLSQKAAQFHAVLSQLATLGNDDGMQVIRFSEYSMLVRQFGARSVVLLLERDANLNLLRVSLRVFILKMKQEDEGLAPTIRHGSAAGTSPGVNTSLPEPIPDESSTGLRRPPRLPTAPISIAQPEALVATGSVERLQASFAHYVGIPASKQCIEQGLKTLACDSADLKRLDYSKLVMMISEEVADTQARSAFIYESYEIVMQAELARRDTTITRMENVEKLLAEGIAICTKLVTPTFGVDPTRDDEFAVGRLSELMGEISNAGTSSNTIELLNLGDRLLIMQEELRYAAELQRSLVPSVNVHQHQACNLASFYRPTMHCGGDWWSVRSLSDSRLMVVIADVTGHGAPSAILTGVLKGAWDQIPESVTSPSEVLQILNEAIFNIYRKMMMATCAVSIVDVERMEFSIASAGHNFPYLVRKTDQGKNKLYSLLARGNALGAAAIAEYKETVVPLEPEDVVVWYTDGATECMNKAGTQFSEKRLRRLLSKVPLDKGPEPVRDHCLQDIEAFCGDQVLEDDMTLLIGSIGKPV